MIYNQEIRLRDHCDLFGLENYPQTYVRKRGRREHIRRSRSP